MIRRDVARAFAASVADGTSSLVSSVCGVMRTRHSAPLSVSLGRKLLTLTTTFTFPAGTGSIFGTGAVGRAYGDGAVGGAEYEVRPGALAYAYASSAWKKARSIAMSSAME